MNFEEAIDAHSAWKQKLGFYLRNPDQSLKAVDVQLDNQCELGKWIYGEGTKYSTKPDYVTLKVEHSKFHKCAASVITQADAGKSMSEEIMLGSSSDFAKTSRNVISAIMRLKKSCAQ